MRKAILRLKYETPDTEYCMGLEYTITAGSKTITGEFEGTLAERLAHVNLLKELAGENGVDKITVKVSHKNGAEIVNTTITLA